MFFFSIKHELFWPRLRMSVWDHCYNLTYSLIRDKNKRYVKLFNHDVCKKLREKTYWNSKRTRVRRRGERKIRRERRGVSRDYFVDRARHVRVLSPSCLRKKEGCTGGRRAKKERRRKESGRSGKWRQCGPNRQARRWRRELSEIGIPAFHTTWLFRDIPFSNVVESDLRELDAVIDNTNGLRDRHIQCRGFSVVIVRYDSREDEFAPNVTHALKVIDMNRSVITCDV